MNTSSDRTSTEHRSQQDRTKDSATRTPPESRGGYPLGGPPKDYNPDQRLGTMRVAEALGLSQRLVQLWCALGKLKACKIGKQWKIRRGDLDDYLRACEADTDNN